MARMEQGWSHARHGTLTSAIAPSTVDRGGAMHHGGGHERGSAGGPFLSCRAVRGGDPGLAAHQERGRLYPGRAPDRREPWRLLRVRDLVRRRDRPWVGRTRLQRRHVGRPGRAVCLCRGHRADGGAVRRATVAARSRHLWRHVPRPVLARRRAPDGDPAGAWLGAVGGGPDPRLRPDHGRHDGHGSYHGHHARSGRRESSTPWWAACSPTSTRTSCRASSSSSASAPCSWSS